MPKLLIQCQSSPGSLSFDVTQAKLDAIIHQYLNYSRHCVIPLKSDTGEWYYVNLALTSWMCVVDEAESESENEPKPSPNNEYPPEL